MVLCHYRSSNFNKERYIFNLLTNSIYRFYENFILLFFTNVTIKVTKNKYNFLYIYCRCVNQRILNENAIEITIKKLVL